MSERLSFETATPRHANNGRAAQSISPAFRRDPDFGRPTPDVTRTEGKKLAPTPCTSLEVERTSRFTSSSALRQMSDVSRCRRTREFALASPYGFIRRIAGAAVSGWSFGS